MKMNTGAWIGIASIIISPIALIIIFISVGIPNAFGISGLVLLFGALFFLVFYKLLIGPALLRKRLEKTGVSGKATIIEVRDTSVTINNNPQVKLILEVKNSFGQIYTTTIRTIVSRINPSMYQPGMIVPVKIDPNNEKIVIIDHNQNRQTTTSRNAFQNNASGNYTQSQINSIKAELELLQKEREAIMLTGVSARAIIKNVNWLGININGNNPYMELELEVLPADAPSFQCKIKEVTGEQSVAKYQPGKEIFVKYNPGDLTKVTIDHS